MVTFTKALIKTTEEQGQESTNISPPENSMKENGYKIGGMAMEYSSMPMEIGMKATGLMICEVVTARLYTQMVIFIKEILQRILQMGEGH